MMGTLAFPWLCLCLVTVWSISLVKASNMWQADYIDHMFPYGSAAGDEKIPVDQLPMTKPTKYTPMFGTGVPYRYIELFADGHLELWHQRDVNVEKTPFIAPYHLPYSEVTSGHMWYREIQDRQTLEKVMVEITKTLPNSSFTVDPDSMIIVTWQWDSVSVRYPECVGAARAHHLPFCDCLDLPNPPVSKYHHLVCECLHKVNLAQARCSKLYQIPHYRYWECDACKDLSFISQDIRELMREYLCKCSSKGNSRYKSGCARTLSSPHFRNRYDIVDPREACDTCGSKCSARGGGQYCRCEYIDASNAIGRLKCFYRLQTSWCKNCTPCYPLRGICQDCTCGDDDVILNEPKLMSCLLTCSPRYTYLTNLPLIDILYFCDDPFIDLDFCACLQDLDRLGYSAPDLRLYCECDIYTGGDPADLCQCLMDHNYTGPLPDCSKTRAAPRISCGIDTTAPEPNMDTSLNTFQAAIVYNEWETYVYFNYLTLQHSGLNIKTQVGYQDSHSGFTGYNHPYPADVNKLHLLLFDSNVDFWNWKGRWLYKVGGTIEQQVWVPHIPSNDCSTFNWVEW